MLTNFKRVLQVQLGATSEQAERAEDDGNNTLYYIQWSTSNKCIGSWLAAFAGGPRKTHTTIWSWINLMCPPSFLPLGTMLAHLNFVDFNAQIFPYYAEMMKCLLRKSSVDFMTARLDSNHYDDSWK